MGTLLIAVALLPSLALAACPFHGEGSALAGRGHGRVLLDAASSDATTSQAYLSAVKQLDVKAVKADLAALLKSSQPQWPSDFGYYGGLFIRLAWHCSGSYRSWDGRGGCDGGRIRFSPESAWPDNTNLDKARSLLEPIKAKYGASLSWGDLIVLAGNEAIETAGGPVLGACLGRVDDVDGTASLELGPSKEQELVAPCNVTGACTKPLGPTTMGLIYVNPEGPMGKPIPNGSFPQIRDTFGRMGMNDSETVALIGGGHAFGKAHGACTSGPGLCGVGASKGKGNFTVTSGFEGPWTTSPTAWSNDYYNNLLSFKWEVHVGPGGKHQWRPTLPVSDKAGPSKAQAVPLPRIMMLTADVSLLEDPTYLSLVNLYAGNISALEDSFKHAWYKLTTRDMGPITRCVDVDGLLPPAQPWQCPLPDAPASQPDFGAVAKKISGIISQPSSAAPTDKTAGGKDTYAALFASLAWQSASSYRETDHQGGTNGARIRFSPIKDWANNKGLDSVLKVLQPVKDAFPGLSYADLIVLAGNVALQDSLALQFTGGRVDASGACVVDEVLAPRQYQSSVISVKDDAAVKGLALSEYLALFALPRSPSQQQHIGYSGSWTPYASTLSNAFFQTLLNETWVNGTSKAGREEYSAKGKQGVYITPMDAALTQDAQLLNIVKEYAANNSAVLGNFSSGWTKMMNAGVPSASGASSTPTRTPSGAPAAASLGLASAVLTTLSAVLLLF